MPILRVFVRAALMSVVAGVVVSGTAMEIGNLIKPNILAFVRVLDDRGVNIYLHDTFSGITYPFVRNVWLDRFAWSPDGSAIAYTSAETGSPEIGLADYLKPSTHILTVSDTVVDHSPTWLPQGFDIAFTSGFTLHIMNVDGSDIKEMDSPFKNCEEPVWSPDGLHIACEIAENSTREIYVMDTSGQYFHNITNNNEDDFNISWSPDGQEIAFTSTRNGNTDVYVMNIDGTNVRNLTRDNSRDLHPSWSSDGSTIAFSSNRNGLQEIFLMDADGQNQRILNYQPVETGQDVYPAWRP